MTKRAKQREDEQRLLEKILLTDSTGTYDQLSWTRDDGESKQNFLWKFISYRGTQILLLSLVSLVVSAYAANFFDDEFLQRLSGLALIIYTPSALGFYHFCPEAFTTEAERRQAGLLAYMERQKNQPVSSLNNATISEVDASSSLTQIVHNPKKLVRGNR